jgi:hypothetical protein
METYSGEAAEQTHFLPEFRKKDVPGLFRNNLLSLELRYFTRRFWKVPESGGEPLSALNP